MSGFKRKRRTNAEAIAELKQVVDRLLDLSKGPFAPIQELTVALSDKLKEVEEGCDEMEKRIEDLENQVMDPLGPFRWMQERMEAMEQRLSVMEREIEEEM